ncbi:MAG: multicopper oxidase domain-containing protein, partial [Spirulinaceae cyanobacterium]
MTVDKNWSSQPFSRRQVLQWSLLGAGGLGTMATVSYLRSSSSSSVRIPLISEELSDAGNGISPLQILREFDWGTLKRENGRTVREFQAVANNSTIYLNSALPFKSWNINGRVPGPTFRAKAGERIRVIFNNQDGHSHTMHFH